MEGERYKVVAMQREGRSWFHVVDSWAPATEQAVEYSFLTRAASDGAAQELNKLWSTSTQRRLEVSELEN